MLLTSYWVPLFCFWFLNDRFDTFHFHIVGADCVTSYSCYGTSSLNNQDCRGDNSCREVTTLTSTNEFPYCTGAFSCYRVNHIDMSFNDDSTLACYGLFSCANNYESVSLVHFGLVCFGELSCVNSIFNISVTPTYCHGSESCTNGIFYNTGADVSGYLGASFTTFISNKYNDYSWFNFGARSSGYHTKIICQTNSTCAIACYTNACNHLQTPICNNCTQIIINCQYSQQNDLCPNGMCTCVMLLFSNVLFRNPKQKKNNNRVPSCSRI